jgi:hypothetical protein
MEGTMGITASIRQHRSLLASVAAVGIIAGVWLSQRPVQAQTAVHVFWGPGGRGTTQDVNGDGLNIGDRVTGRGPLLDAAQANEVGRGFQDCVAMTRITDYPGEEPGGMYWCTYVLRLTDGDLTIKGLDPHGPGVYTFAVLGGTGTYAGAVGEATLTDGPSGTEFVVDLSG